MTNKEQDDGTYTTSKSVENFASSLGPSLYPGIFDLPPAIVVTPRQNSGKKELNFSAGYETQHQNQ